jgi:hypothetical protein
MCRKPMGSSASLPKACSCTTGVVVESSLYALGGRDDRSYLDLVQKLSLESLSCEIVRSGSHLQVMLSPVSS